MSALATDIESSAPASTSAETAGLINLVMASVAMTATLPGRTHGLGLITKSLTDDASLGVSESLFSHLEGMLISQGLYPQEAHAMLETWKNSWFEEGSRLFYIVPRSFLDSVLPLSISPAPAEMVSPEPPRSPLAPHKRFLPHLDFGSDAATDPRGRSDSLLPKISGTLPDGPRPCARP